MLKGGGGVGDGLGQRIIHGVGVVMIVVGIDVVKGQVCGRGSERLSE